MDLNAVAEQATGVPDRDSLPMKQQSERVRRRLDLIYSNQLSSGVSAHDLSIAAMCAMSTWPSAVSTTSDTTSPASTDSR